MNLKGRHSGRREQHYQRFLFEGGGGGPFRCYERKKKQFAAPNLRVAGHLGRLCVLCHKGCEGVYPPRCSRPTQGCYV